MIIDLTKLATSSLEELFIEESLELSDDIANIQLKGDWHIPTKEQQEELIAGCTCLWIWEKGV